MWNNSPPEKNPTAFSNLGSIDRKATMSSGRIILKHIVLNVISKYPSFYGLYKQLLHNDYVLHIRIFPGISIVKYFLASIPIGKQPVLPLFLPNVLVAYHVQIQIKRRAPTGISRKNQRAYAIPFSRERHYTQRRVLFASHCYFMQIYSLLG